MDMNTILANPITQQILMEVVKWGLPILLAGITWLIVAGVKLLIKKIKESNTKMDDYLLGVAVKFVEDKFGPDTGNGREKLRAACEYVEEITKGKLKADAIEPMVRAKYVEIFGALGNGKNA